MKPWCIAGVCLFFAGALLLIQSAGSSQAQTSAERYLIQVSSRLESYAQAHERRYPDSLAELELAGFATNERAARDPWGRPYVYERHPADPERCRIYTLGRDGKVSPAGDATELVLYRLAGRTVWRRALEEVPREW